MATRVVVSVFVLLIVYVASQSPVAAQSCPGSECYYNTSILSDHLSCDMVQFGDKTPPCYGEWSRLQNCKCEDGFDITETNNQYWCSGGNWDSDLYDLGCKGPCTIDADENAIATDSNGNIVTGTVPSGDRVEYSCPEGYANSGKAQVACDNGVWEDHEPFECLASCNFPNNTSPTDTSVVEPAPHGSVIGFQCDQGYVPRDITSSTCEDGTFDPEIACSVEQCADDQCELEEDNLDGKLTYASPQRYGNPLPPSYCYGRWSFIDSFSCSGAKWVVRPVVSTIYCNEIDGVYQWTEDIHNLTCREPCRRLPGIPSNVTTVDPHGVETTLFEHESYVTYHCADGDATILGVKTASCYDGSWDNQAIPQCLGSCNFPSNSRSTRGKEEPISHGDTVILQCNDGYVPRDTVTAQCQDGSFNPGLECTSSS